jgi:hypothetical protein
MRIHGVVAATALAASLLLPILQAQALDDAKYPDWSGVWRATSREGFRYDDSKPRGARQEAPLTPEYQAIYEANLKDQAAGGQGVDPTYTCLSPGMPRIMSLYEPMEIVVTPGTVHLLIEHIHDSRRIHTDGRPWPDQIEPSFRGYSIGTWIDSDGDGRYDVLRAETRYLKGPRVFDSSGTPFHKDNRTVITERIHLDRSNPNLLIDELTTIDNALTRPWSATKTYRRDPSVKFHVWEESVCAEKNGHLEIAGEGYMLSAEGLLMPTRKDQRPPDLRYFKPAQR